MSKKTEALLGIDVGTTNVKAALYTREGRPLALSSSPLPALRPRPGWEEYDPEMLYACVCKTVQNTLRQAGQDCAVAGLAIASMAETAIPVDKQGHALANAVAWHDERSLAQAEWWRKELGADTIYKITGLPPAYIFGANKLMWFRKHAPDAYAKTRCWLNVADYIAYRLSGVQATDYSLASRLMLLDLATGRWSEELLAAADIASSIFADLVPSGQTIGAVHAQGALASGLAQGTAVVSGGHDHPCGALALGITKPGDVLDSMGTSESIFTVVDRPVLEAGIAQTGYQQGFHVVPASYYANGGLYTSGRCVEWLKELLQADAALTYEDLLTLAQVAPVGSRGVFFLPHLRMANTPIDDPHSRGAFVGLSIASSRDCVARAVFEGLAYEAQASLDGLKERLLLTTRRVRAIGGGTRNPLLMKMKAALLDIPLEICDVKEATTLGAALLAGWGAGVYQTLDEAASTLRLTASQVPVDEDLKAYYQTAYTQVYKQLYLHLAPLSHEIVRLD